MKNSHIFISTLFILFFAFHVNSQNYVFFDSLGVNQKFATVHALNDGNLLINCRRSIYVPPGDPIPIEGSSPKNALHKVTPSGELLWTNFGNAVLDYSFIDQIFEDASNNLFSIHSYYDNAAFFSCDGLSSYLWGYNARFTKKDFLGNTISNALVYNPSIYNPYTFVPYTNTQCGERYVGSTYQLNDGTLLAIIRTKVTSNIIGQQDFDLGGIIRINSSGQVLNSCTVPFEMLSGSIFMGANGILKIAYPSTNLESLKISELDASFSPVNTNEVAGFTDFGLNTHFKVFQIGNGNYLVATVTPESSFTPNFYTYRIRVLNSNYTVLSDQNMDYSTATPLIHFSELNKFAFARGNGLQTSHIQIVNSIGTFGDSFEMPNSESFIPTNMTVSNATLAVVGQYNCCLPNEIYSSQANGFIYLDTTIIPSIQPEAIIIVINSNNSTFGTVSGGGAYYLGDECSVTATPNQGYMFSGFYDGTNLLSNSNPYTFVVNEPLEITALFEVDNASGLPLEYRKIKNLVYPNPFQDKVEIQNIESVKTITVKDLNGRIVFSIQEVSVNEVNLAFLESGLYMLEIFSDHGIERFSLVKL